MYNYNYKNYDFAKKYLNPNVCDSLEDNLYSEIKMSTSEYKKFYYHPEERIEDDYIISPLPGLDKRFNGGEPFEYKMNRSGFRSQHFENIKSDDINILFAGCSWTYGDGLPDEMVWRSVLTEKIKTLYPNENVEQYNVGTGGASIPLIFKNVLAFLRDHDSVDYVYMLLPGFDRQSCIDEEIERGRVGFRKVVYCSPDDRVFNIPTIKKFAINYVPEDYMMSALPMIKAIEDICKLRRIKLYWGSWVPMDHRVYEEIDFNNYVKMPIWERIYNMTNLSDKTYYKLASDDAHPGLEHMTKLADAFYEASFGK